MGPLEGLRALEYANYPAAGFAGLLLRMQGASVDMLEPAGRSKLRDHPPRHEGRSALYGYLSAGKQLLAQLQPGYLDGLNLVLHDEELPAGVRRLIDQAPLPPRGRAVVRCTPYGATGPKSAWQATELTLFHAGGEAYLMPHGLPFEEHPERPPIGIGRYSAHYQGGIAAALAAVAALRQSRASGRTEHVDLSIQDTEVSLNYFTVSRHVEGVRESRATRAFRYAGILRCADGWIELAPLENHHWPGVLTLVGHPADLMTSEFADLMARAAHGGKINAHLRRWAAGIQMEEAVELATQAGIPCGPYLAPAELPDDAQLAHRGFFLSEEDHPTRAQLYPGPAWKFNRWDKPRLRRADSREGADDAST